jgi:hypothetical protein
MPLPTMSLRVAPEYHQLIRDIATALRTRPELADVLHDVLQTQHDNVLQSQHDGIAPRDTDVLQSILDRLAALEEREPRMVRIDAVEARITALEAGASMPVTASADSERPAVTRQPRPASVGQGAGGSKRMTAEQDRQIADLLNAGRPYSEIAPAVGVSIGRLTKIKKRLAEQGLLTAIPDEHSEQAYLCQIAGMTVAEAIELKGWTWEEHELAAAVERWREKHHVQEMLLLEHHHQIATMLEAGKSGVEIKAWLAQQRAELPASHVDENPVPPHGQRDADPR